MNVILIPCWNRPEFLWHTLDNLTKAEGFERHAVIIRPDNGYDPNIREVVREFAGKGLLQNYHFIQAVPHRYSRSTKQSANVLEGLKIAASMSDDLVYLVEEDIMVGRDFFTFHEEVNKAEPNLFCSLSTKNHNRQVATADDQSAYYLTTLDYCSLGVCFKKSTIQDRIAPHITQDYYRSPMSYITRSFPNSVIGRSFCEQDGLIRRIQEELCQDAPIAYPHRPRAFHAGYYGYNRMKGKAGSFSMKLYEVGLIIYDSERMRIASQRPEFFRDSEPVPLELPAWTTLRRLQPEQAPF